MHKTIGYKKKYTRYDEKNEIRRKSKKYLGQYHRLLYISLYSRKILYTNFFEKTLAYYTWKMYYYASKAREVYFYTFNFRKYFTSRLKWYIIRRNDCGNTLPQYSKYAISRELLLAPMEMVKERTWERWLRSELLEHPVMQAASS